MNHQYYNIMIVMITIVALHCLQKSMASITEAKFPVTTTIFVKIILLTILFPKATSMATLGTAETDGK